MATEATVGSNALLPLPVHPLLLQVHARCDVGVRPVFPAAA